MLSESRVNEIADKLSVASDVDRGTIFDIFWMHSQRIRPNEDILSSMHITEEMKEPLQSLMSDVGAIRDEERLTSFLVHLDGQAEQADQEGNRDLVTYITMSQIVVMNKLMELIE